MATTKNRNIRWLVLVILLAQRKEGAAESGGWINEALLRRLLAFEGYPLSIDELRVFIDYLADSEVACLERSTRGDVTERTYRYRLTAKGMRVAEREIVVPGIGINGEDE